MFNKINKKKMEAKDNIYYAIIQRYYKKFHRKRNKELFIHPKKEEIKLLSVYSRNTIFSSNKNIVKEMLVIHYSRENDIGVDNTPNIYRLSIDLDHYYDLL